MFGLFKNIFLISACAVVYGFFPPQAFARVPATDQEWNHLAKGVILEVNQGRPAAKVLFRLLPQMQEILKMDSQRTYMKALWGTSLNRDEFTRSEIVDPKIIAMLSQEVGAPSPDGDRVFAGIEHTYGYLFSTLETKFGHKRLRWIQGALESGFDLPTGILGPFPAEGTLFGNVTYFLGRIAFRGDERIASQLSLLTEGIAKSVVQYSYESLETVRVLEEVHLEDSRQVRLRTDLVPFLRSSKTGGSTHLLVYSIEDSRNPLPQLISGFPVDDEMVESLVKAQMGENVSITSRYNGVVPGLSGKKVDGKRTLISNPQSRLRKIEDVRFGE